MLGVERIGRYQVLGHLASGGMGQVYLAKTTGLGGFERHVVVKTLDVADDEDQFVTMFLDGGAPRRRRSITTDIAPGVRGRSRQR